MIAENILSGRELRIGSEILFWGIVATEDISSVPLEI